MFCDFFLIILQSNRGFEVIWTTSLAEMLQQALCEFFSSPQRTLAEVMDVSSPVH